MIPLDQELCEGGAMAEPLSHRAVPSAQQGEDAP